VTRHETEVGAVYKNKEENLKSGKRRRKLRHDVETLLTRPLKQILKKKLTSY
jgi:hypothetical protein